MRVTAWEYNQGFQSSKKGQAQPLQPWTWVNLNTSWPFQTQNERPRAQESGGGQWAEPARFNSGILMQQGPPCPQLAFEDRRKASFINLLTFYHSCEPLGPWKQPQLDKTSSPRPLYLNPFSFHNENDFEKTRENPKQSTGHFPGTFSSVCSFVSSIHMLCHFICLLSF